MSKYILMDIEGTTTSISFVHDVLFPYTRKHLAEFINNNITDKCVIECLNDTKETVRLEESRDIDTTEAVKTLLHWINIDRKHPALKTLQGLVWKDGYSNSNFTAHIYDDVIPCIQKWHDSGKVLAIYSSGSVEAQKLLFKHTCFGDLTKYISHYFDLQTGRKQEPDSYRRITDRLSAESSDILFLSDSADELNAAISAGLRTTQLIRKGTHPCTNHRNAKDFTEVEID